MRVGIVLVVVALAGCGKPSDSEFKPYLEAFRAAVTVSVPEIPIYFDAGLHWGVSGQCLAGEIQISPSKWSKMTEDERTVLITHELGHCAFGLPHNDARLEDGCPESVMVSGAPGPRCFGIHRERYFQILTSAQPQ